MLALKWVPEDTAGSSGSTFSAVRWIWVPSGASASAACRACSAITRLAMRCAA